MQYDLKFEVLVSINYHALVHKFNKDGYLLVLDMIFIIWFAADFLIFYTESNATPAINMAK